jgi:hypothetical protein
MNEPSPSVALKCVMSRPRVVSRVSGARTLIVQGLGARPVAGSRRPVGLFDIERPFHRCAAQRRHATTNILTHQSRVRPRSQKRIVQSKNSNCFLYDQPRAHGHAAGWFTQDPTSCRAAQHRPHQPTTKPPKTTGARKFRPSPRAVSSQSLVTLKFQDAET